MALEYLPPLLDSPILGSPTMFKTGIGFGVGLQPKSADKHPSRLVDPTITIPMTMDPGQTTGNKTTTLSTLYGMAEFGNQLES